MNQKGITLIALVITIIVLLILAGISIAMLTGENGILTKASDSKEKTDRNNIIEQAKINIFEKQTDNLGTLTEDELTEILKVYGTLSEKEEESSVLDKTLTTFHGNYTIGVREIWDGTFAQGKISFTILGEDLVDDWQKKYLGTYSVEKGTTWMQFFHEKFPEDSVGWLYSVETNDIFLYLDDFGPSMNVRNLMNPDNSEAFVTDEIKSENYYLGEFRSRGYSDITTF